MAGVFPPISMDVLSAIRHRFEARHSIKMAMLGGLIDRLLKDGYTARKLCLDNCSGPMRHFFSTRGLSSPFGVRRGVSKQHKDTSMANTSSAKKAARQMIRRTEVNKGRRSRVKTEVRSVEEAIKSGDRAKAEAALRAAEPLLVRTAQKGIMHKKTASRKVSRLAKRVKAMSA